MNSAKIIDKISWAFLVITLVLLKFTSNYVENLISGKRFVFEMAGIGILLASAWIFGLLKIYPSYFKGGEKRASAVLSQFFSIVILTIFLSTYYNYQTGVRNLSREKVIVIDRSKNVMKGTTYVTLFIQNREERFNPKAEEWNKLTPGDTLDIMVGYGALKWKFIYQFSTEQIE